MGRGTQDSTLRPLLWNPVYNDVPRLRNLLPDVNLRTPTIWLLQWKHEDRNYPKHGHDKGWRMNNRLKWLVLTSVKREKLYAVGRKKCKLIIGEEIKIVTIPKYMEHN